MTDRDLFGDLIVPVADAPAYMQPPAAVSQPRLFEPQMEGQLDLLDDDERGGSDGT